jgi:hypothetical protein
MNDSVKVDNISFYQNLSIETLRNEYWKPVIGYESCYVISNLGRLKSLDRQRWTGNGYHLLRGIVLKQSLTTTGYLKANLTKDGKCKVWKIHQLMAMSFLNHTPCGFRIVVDHIDRNPLNNHISNLRLVTNRANTRAPRKEVSSHYTGVWWREDVGKWAASIQIKGKIKKLGVFKQEIEAAKAYYYELNKNK